MIDDLCDASVGELAVAIARGELSALELTEHCLARISELDPLLNAVIAVDPTALEQARTSDARRASGSAGPLQGIPVLVKDNIAVAGMPTTAGSRALAGSCPPDAPLVGRLRSSGAVILGKTNLSEWANFRSRHSASGWSAIGGQAHNPHVLDRSPSGSSSGSAVAAAAGLAPLTVGTETDGSIVSPAGVCGVVGFKPTLGTVPGGGIVPISSAQDVAGPITRTVADAAALFAVLSGSPRPRLRADALRGARIGVWAPGGADAPETVLDKVVAVLAAAGAATVPVQLSCAGIEAGEWPALLAEFKHELNDYLASAPGAAVTGLAELIAFNITDEIELSLFGQDNLEAALVAPPLSDPTYREQRAQTTSQARAQIDATLAQHRLDAIVTLTNEVGWRTDYTVDEQFSISTSTPAAAAGYPAISVPGGFVGVLPVGVSFIGSFGTDARILAYAFAFEQATLARRRPGYLHSLDG